MKILVAFDVSSNKRRRRLTKVLMGFGYRHHESVFVCDVNNAKAFKLRKKIERTISVDGDKVRFLHLCDKDIRLILDSAQDSCLADPLRGDACFIE